MSGGGRGNRGGGRGRGRNNGPARGGNCNPSTAKKKGMCATLGEHIFTHGEKGSTDKFNSTKDKLVESLGTAYTQDIATETQTGDGFVIKPPEHDSETKEEHKNNEAQRKTLERNL